jgi:hypothetical protein
MTIIVRVGTWGFPLVSGLHAAGMPVCTTLQQLPPGRTTGGRQNRCPEHPPNARSARCLPRFYVGGPYRMKRDLSSKKKKLSRDRESRREFSTHVQH